MISSGYFTAIKCLKWNFSLIQALSLVSHQPRSCAATDILHLHTLSINIGMLEMMAYDLKVSVLSNIC